MTRKISYVVAVFQKGHDPYRADVITPEFASYIRFARTKEGAERVARELAIQYPMWEVHLGEFNEVFYHSKVSRELLTEYDKL